MIYILYDYIIEGKILSNTYLFLICFVRYYILLHVKCRPSNVSLLVSPSYTDFTFSLLSDVCQSDENSIAETD